MWQKLRAVALRELGIWIRRPIYLVGSVLVLGFCTLFYLSFFHAGVPTDLPIAVVDLDGTSLSRNFIRQLDATQLGSVRRFETFPEARAEMQAGRVTAVCVLPKGFLADVNAQRQPRITFYINGLYFVGGSLAWKDLLQMVNLTSGAVQREVLRQKGLNDRAISGQIRPVDIDVHQIGNATMNYGAYISNIMLPGVLEMIIVILVIYSLGTELKYGTSRHLLEKAGHDIVAAVLGKLLVYTLLFTALGLSLVLIFYRFLHFPFAGSIWSMALGMFLFVLACEAVAVTIIGLVPVLRFALSIGALYSVLGFSLAGFTLPIEAMPAPFTGLAAIYPLRAYYLFYVQEGIYANGFAGWYPQVIHLLVFLLLPLLSLGRLQHAYIYQDYERN
ncbi:MAG: ABC transporter permease [Bacteroidales bacterium]|nr:ABC transporter permease [Bacteroidales bacterium]